MIYTYARELILTHGLPASGKTTWALEEIARRAAARKTNPNVRPVIRVNRDLIREMLMFEWPSRDRDLADYIKAENLCTVTSRTTIKAALEDGFTVIVDDTNLNPQYTAPIRDIARETGACLRIQKFTHVPVEECIARDARRAKPVGSWVIQNMHKRYLAGRP